MKPYLLIAGENYYPSAGTGDWINTFTSYEEALAVIETVTSVGRRQKTYNRYKINNIHYDWYEIIDLKTWIFKE